MATTFFSRILLLLSSLILLSNIPSYFALSIPNIRVISDLPKDSDPCYIGVEPIGATLKSHIAVQDFALRQGEEAEIEATLTNYMYTAVFQWKDLEGEIEAYDPKRDAGKNNIYWKISPDGFFYGYDQDHITNKVSAWQQVTITN